MGGDEGHEACEQVREGEAREARCLPWEQGGDGWRADQGQLDEEQEREDREQEAERERQEGLRPDQGLDRRRDEGAEGARHQGIPRREEGHAPLQEGEGVLRPVKERRMSDSYLGLDQRDGACSGKWGSPTACLSEGCV